MNLIIVALKSALFYFTGIGLWVVGTLFHGFLWWSLGLPEIPFFLPWANLIFLPFGFWLAWQILMHPQRIHCDSCRSAGRKTVPAPRRRPAPVSVAKTVQPQ